MGNRRRAAHHLGTTQPMMRRRCGSSNVHSFQWWCPAVREARVRGGLWSLQPRPGGRGHAHQASSGAPFIGLLTDLLMFPLRRDDQASLRLAGLPLPSRQQGHCDGGPVAGSWRSHADGGVRWVGVALPAAQRWIRPRDKHSPPLFCLTQAVESAAQRSRGAAAAGARPAAGRSGLAGGRGRVGGRGRGRGEGWRGSGHRCLAAVPAHLLTACRLAACVQDEVADRLLDRLEDCTRTFPKAVVLGGGGAQVGGWCCPFPHLMDMSCLPCRGCCLSYGLHRQDSTVCTCLMPVLCPDRTACVDTTRH